MIVGMFPNLAMEAICTNEAIERREKGKKKRTFLRRKEKVGGGTF